MINKGCMAMVRGTEWEAALYQAETRNSDVRAFKRASEAYDREVRPWMSKERA